MCRNPLSLDMGWKDSKKNIVTCKLHFVAIRFRWIWVEKEQAIEVVEAVAGRNPLSLDMGWKDWKTSSLRLRTRCRNPLSLDMGWKEATSLTLLQNVLSQSAFAGYGLKSFKNLPRHRVSTVAIRFRWIWVEKLNRNAAVCTPVESQSAFAGYGLKRLKTKRRRVKNSVAIRFRWIWVEKLVNTQHT